MSRCAGRVLEPARDSGVAVRTAPGAAADHDADRRSGDVGAGLGPRSRRRGSKLSTSATRWSSLGSVRRRFFRAGGATASRVEIEAEVVCRARDRRRSRGLHRRIEELLEALES